MPKNTVSVQQTVAVTATLSDFIRLLPLILKYIEIIDLSLGMRKSCYW